MAWQGRNRYYSGAIGTEALMAEIALDQAMESDRKHVPECPACEDGLAAVAEDKLAGGSLRIGQVQVAAQPVGFQLRHVEDEGLRRTDRARRLAGCA